MTRTTPPRRNAAGRRLALAVLCGLLAAAPAASAFWTPAPRRVVSLVPALTDMVVAIGAADRLAAVSSYDDLPEVRHLPRVGALLDPDLERILALRPDLVLVYGSQTDVMTQLQRAGIPYFEYRHGGLAHVTSTIRALGARLDCAAAAERVAGEIERRLGALRAQMAGAHRPRTLLVFGRERGTLRNIYASGGRGFLHDMLEAAGGVNVFADIDAEAVQVSTEMILARQPEVIIEIRSAGPVDPPGAEREMEAWRVLASVPAVRDGRLHLLAGRWYAVPGPRVAESAEAMARVLHP